jgi:hypothetical protein
MGRNAASVLPVAVGDSKRTFLPSRIIGIVFCCGSVGFWNPFCSTSLRTGFTSNSKAFSEVACKIELYSLKDMLSSGYKRRWGGKS